MQKSKKYVEIFSGPVHIGSDCRVKCGEHSCRLVARSQTLAKKELSGTSRGMTNCSHHPNRPSHCYPSSRLPFRLTIETLLFKIK